MTRKVVVFPYDPRWQLAYILEADNLLAIFEPELLSIHHIGSTAIPGIKARPIIDILVEVKDIERVDTYNSQVIASGLQSKGEFGIRSRRFMIRSDEDGPTHHVYVFQTESPEINRYLNFRDYLHRHSGDAQTYSCLKEELANKYPEAIDQYLVGKDSLIKEIDCKAGEWLNNLQESVHDRTAT
jgi:GrpB-like predicted nucleotidyltransferase (UPF0157 family)